MYKKYITNFFKFYIDGFKNMKLGRKLWLIIIIKLVIMFGVLKVFVFNNTLNSKFKSNEEKSDFVLLNLTKE
ncbi:DUF4492 domain-containing protein [Campylobacter pinnipediorum]|uniref:DUF4492 domain-containing protein n=1 Tax=Campylobacter pinnipediorum subsp. pinnipediorum TaxID=1660067 RepID=A0AAX0L8C2_9BACT|nr:DUF4492 domain-containing protein [Campylobacter pinnipediorum]OPA75933.1 DUF4492 domain-containing protein [Campylobacter pinnipediorum subsp. pinnipediorum]OPA75958.1 DUF4492 domain-containing protein [Campylobacter pinnipediorum subsp. pinnipediorum]